MSERTSLSTRWGNELRPVVVAVGGGAGDADGPDEEDDDSGGVFRHLRFHRKHHRPETVNCRPGKSEHTREPFELRFLEHRAVP